MSHLVSAAWLADHLSDKNLVVLDASVRIPTKDDPRTGHDQYLRAHIPGARFADVPGALSDPAHRHRFMVPSAARFSAEMERLGISHDTHVVVYSRGFMFWATRLWWLFQVFGHEHVSVLDGGFAAWKAAGLPVAEGDEPATEKGVYAASVNAGLIAEKGDVEAARSGAACLVDALPATYYSGADGDLFGYGRAGHITGAQNVPNGDFLDVETGCFKPLSEIKAMVDTALPDRDAPIISYCGGGIAATQVAFVLDMAGRKNVRVYDASLQEWASDPSLPMETGLPMETD